jgi:hypothetical protein
MSGDIHLTAGLSLENAQLGRAKLGEAGGLEVPPSGWGVRVNPGRSHQQGASAVLERGGDGCDPTRDAAVWPVGPGTHIEHSGHLGGRATADSQQGGGDEPDDTIVTH